MTRLRAVIVLAALSAPWPAFAQSATPSAPARITFDVGALVIGGAQAGTTTETYTAPDGSAVPQFTLDKSVSPAFGVNGHVSFRVTSRVAFEVGAEWARPQLRTKLSGDTDGADSATATQSIHRFALGGGATVGLRSFGRWQAFARGSVGWLRELSNDQTLFQDGWVAQAGGGANYLWKAPTGHFRPYGIRADLWLDIRHGGLDFSDKPRLLAPAFSAAVIFKL